MDNEYNLSQRLTEARTALAEARGILHDVEDDERVARARAEQGAIESAEDGVYGKNAEERARFLVLALEQSTQYKAAHRELRDAQVAVERREAYLASLLDERHDRDHALFSRGLDRLDQGVGLQGLTT